MCSRPRFAFSRSAVDSQKWRVSFWLSHPSGLAQPKASGVAVASPPTVVISRFHFSTAFLANEKRKIAISCVCWKTLDWQRTFLLLPDWLSASTFLQGHSCSRRGTSHIAATSQSECWTATFRALESALTSPNSWSHDFSSSDVRLRFGPFLSEESGEHSAQPFLPARINS